MHYLNRLGNATAMLKKIINISFVAKFYLIFWAVIIINWKVKYWLFKSVPSILKKKCYF